MKGYLKSYQVIMHTVGPVFIGSGKEMKKKEYMFLNGRKTVGIPDIQRLYAELKKRKKETDFEEYLLGKGNMELTDWLIRQKIKPEELKSFLKYTLDCDRAIVDRENKLQIMECIKDAYGNPYIPGSSLKGMFRTILLGADILQEPAKYEQEKGEMLREVGHKSGRTYYLKRNIENIENIEAKAYRVLDRPKTRPEDAVSDCLQGFIVSDSEPLSTDNLVLCQKIDRHTNGTEKKLPLLRECIKPDTEIRFTITFDTSICALSAELLEYAMKRFIENYYNCFSQAFDMDIPKANYVLCGGGCGFVSKTIVYPMYGKEKGIEFAQNVFQNTISGKVQTEHKHYKDKEYGASPHTIKCTRYQGKLLQMGVCICRIEKMRAL